MIIITTEWKDKLYQHKYTGNIKIVFNDPLLEINWWLDTPIEVTDEWISWSTNGYDAFYLTDVISIEGM